LQVLEYSDIPDDLVEKTTSEGRLTYHLGNIAIHLLNRDFVKSVASASQEQANRLLYHGALKKVKCLDETGNTLLPDAPNGLKAETFVFDAIPLAQNASIFEIDRLEEFAPIKNSTGTDSPESSRKIQLSRARRWLLNAGIKPLPKEAEISPSYAPTQQHFLEKTSNLSIDPAAMQDQKIMIDESGITAAQKYNEQLIND
jgi:UDP-N-acetylglucosamine pyrophosphorylase